MKPTTVSQTCKVTSSNCFMHPGSWNISILNHRLKQYRPKQQIFSFEMVEPEHIYLATGDQLVDQLISFSCRWIDELLRQLLLWNTWPEAALLSFWLTWRWSSKVTARRKKTKTKKHTAFVLLKNCGSHERRCLEKYELVLKKAVNYT